MNRQFKGIWRTLRTIAHSIMVHARFLEAYIHFALMYTTYHIFRVLPIKYLINKDGDLTTPFKLAKGTKTSVSHLHMLFFCICCTEIYCTCWDKGVKYASQITKGFSQYIRWNYIVSKRISCVRTDYKEDKIFI